VLLLLDALTGAALLAATGATDELAAGAEYALSEVVDVGTGAAELTVAAELTGATVLTGAAEDSWVEEEATGRPEYTGKPVLPVPAGAVPVPIGPTEDVPLP